MNKKKLGFKLIMVLGVGMLLLAGCNKKDNNNLTAESQEETKTTEENQESTAESDKENVTSDSTGKLALTVNDATVNLDELMYYIFSIEEQGNSYEQMYSTNYGTSYWDTEAEEGVTMRDKAKNYVIDTAVMYEILYDKAVKEEYTLTEEEIAECENSTNLFYGDLTVEQLRITGLTKEVLQKIYEKLTLAEKYYTYITENLEIDEQVIKDSVNKSDYTQYDTKCLFLSRINTDESGNTTELAEEELQKAQESMEKALEMVNAGDDFSVIAAEAEVQTTEISFAIGDQTVAVEYETAVLALEVGAHSDIIETSDGFYIIQLIDNTSSERYDAAIESAITTAKTEGFYAEYEILKKEYQITMNNEVWDPIIMGETTIKTAE